MQTFLPVADFADSARLLDSPRLGKQRVETLQILRAIELPDYGWANHPAVLMWRGRTPALVAYGLAMARVWQERGFADSTDERRSASSRPRSSGRPQDELAARRAAAVVAGRRGAAPLAPVQPDRQGPRLLPAALRRAVRCRARRPALRLAAARRRAAGRRRPRASRGVGGAAAQRTTSSAPAWPPGWWGWARSRASTSTPPGSRRPSCGRCPRSCRDGARPRTCGSCRRSSTRSRPGDRVALPIEHGAGLLLGEVVGDYLFQGRELLPHRRPARWDRVVPRSAAAAPGHAAGPAGALPGHPRPGVRCDRRRPGSGTFCSRTWPRATSLPSSARVRTHLPELERAALLDRLGDDVEARRRSSAGGSRCCC